MNNKSGIYKRTVGAISGWDQITTDNNTTNTKPVSDHDYTIVDLELMLRGIKKMFDPKYLDRIESIIHTHIEDKNNPHKTDLSKLHVDALQELYKIWLEEGYQGSRDKFIKVLFQYVKIASVETALKGESYDEITSVKDVFEMLERHNLDENAHTGLFSSLFPGGEITFDPTFSVKAYLGLPYSGYDFTREGKMWVVGCDGYLKEVEEDEVGIDYSLGCASIPIFDETYNLVTESEDFYDRNHFTCENGSIDVCDAFTSMREEESYVRVFLEKNTVEASVHGIRYNRDNIETVDDEYYTVSCFVRPYGRDSVGIFVENDLVGSIYSFVQFDLKNEKVFYHTELENVIGEMYPIFNGWYRICMTFRAVEGGLKIRPKIYTLDIYDGDMTHSGKDGLGIGLFGLMVSKGEKIVPYIPSIGEQGKIGKSSLVFDIEQDNWYNKLQGTWVFDFDSYKNVLINKNKTLFTIANGVQNSVLISKYPPGYRNRLYYTSFDGNNQALTSMWCNPSEIDKTVSCYAYGKDYHICATYGDPTISVASKLINENAGKIYVGTNRLLGEHFNGYFYGFCYYPFRCTEDQIRYIRGKE